MGWIFKRESRRRSRPAIESLEGRAVPATFHAANVDQLVADIQAINNTSGSHTIVLANRTYNLPGELHIQNAANVTIVGSTTNPSTVTLFAGNNSRAFNIDNSNVTLSGVTITGGNNVSQGAGISAQNSNVTLNSTAVSGNAARGIGGGIYTQGGTLNLNDSSLNGNISTTFGGGIYANNTVVTLKHSTINNNLAANGNVSPQVQALNAGGGIYSFNGSLAINGSSVTNNRVFASTSGDYAASLGGGVASNNAVVTVAGSRIQNNALNTLAAKVNPSLGSAFSTEGGSLTITNSTIGGNGPARQYEFYNPGATVTITNTTVEGRKLVGTFTVGTNGLVPEQ